MRLLQANILLCLLGAQFAFAQRITLSIQDTVISDIQWFRLAPDSTNFMLLTGEMQDSLITLEEGIYYATYDQAGCEKATNYAHILCSSSLLEDPVTIAIRDEPNTSYQWFQNGMIIPTETNNQITTDTQGIYQVSIMKTGCPPEITTYSIIAIPDCHVTLGDFVFFDANADGLQDSLDVPVENIKVTLFDANTGLMQTQDNYGNTITGMTLTNANGNYLFDSLPAGNYFVEFSLGPLPDSNIYNFTIPNVSGNSMDSIDSDADTLLTGNTLVGRTEPTGFIDLRDSILTLDAGIVCILTVGVDDRLNICQTRQVVLNDLNPFILPPNELTAFWRTDGTGIFDQSNNQVGIFGVDQIYIPSNEDIRTGTIVLTLEVNAPFCGDVIDEVRIEILRVDCGTFPWSGNN